MAHNIITVILNLMEEKQNEVSNQEFDRASKVRDRIDFLKVRADKCYDACSEYKHPEFLPALTRILAAYLENQGKVDPAVTSLQLAEMGVLLKKLHGISLS